MKNNKIILLIAFLILGVLVSVQFRSTLSASKDKASRRFDIDQLITQIENERELERELKERIEANSRERDKIYNAYFEYSDNENLKNEWESIRLKTGFVDVKGPGIRIKLDDAPSKREGDIRNLIIHDQDIRIILNEMKSAGAQAISINGERIMAMSELVCAGPTILINKNRYAVPYVINVIGNPDGLYEAASNSMRIAFMKNDGIRVEIEKSDEILVPRFTDIDNENLKKFITGLEVVKDESN